MPAKSKMLALIIMVMTWTVVTSTYADLWSIAEMRPQKRIKGLKLRGSKNDIKARRDQNRRIAKGKHQPSGGQHHSSYMGCLSLSSQNLTESWIFSGEAPNCSYTHTDTDDDSNGDGSDGGDGNGGGGDEDGDNQGDGDQGGDDGGDGDGDGDDSGNNDDGSGNNGGGSDVVVSNEDISNGDDYDPFDDFVLSQCNTYNNLWMWDLSLSCESEASFENCNCTFAEDLLDAGLLTCDDYDRCPASCPICSTCLTLIGCRDPGLMQGPTLSTSIILYIIAALVALFIICLAIYYSRRKSEQENELNKNLIVGDDSEYGFNFTKSGSKIPAWEPPSVKPVQFSPSTVAASTVAGAVFAGDVGKKDDYSESDESGESLDATVLTGDETIVRTPDEEPAPIFPDDVTAATIPDDATAPTVLDDDATATTIPDDATAPTVHGDVTVPPTPDDDMVSEDSTAPTTLDDATAPTVLDDATAATIPDDDIDATAVETTPASRAQGESSVPAPTDYAPLHYDAPEPAVQEGADPQDEEVHMEDAGTNEATTEKTIASEEVSKMGANTDKSKTEKDWEKIDQPRSD